MGGIQSGQGYRGLNKHPVFTDVLPLEASM